MCVTITTISVRTFPSPPKESLCSFPVIPHCHRQQLPLPAHSTQLEADGILGARASFPENGFGACLQHLLVAPAGSAPFLMGHCCFTAVMNRVPSILLDTRFSSFCATPESRLGTHGTLVLTFNLHRTGAPGVVASASLHWTWVCAAPGRAFPHSHPRYHFPFPHGVSGGSSLPLIKWLDENSFSGSMMQNYSFPGWRLFFLDETLLD